MRVTNSGSEARGRAQQNKVTLKFHVLQNETCLNKAYLLYYSNEGSTLTVGRWSQKPEFESSKNNAQNETKDETGKKSLNVFLVRICCRFQHFYASDFSLLVSSVSSPIFAKSTRNSNLVIQSELRIRRIKTCLVKKVLQSSSNNWNY